MIAYILVNFALYGGIINIDYIYKRGLIISMLKMIESPDNSYLHKAFIRALGDNLISHSDVNQKPLDLDLDLPFSRFVRLYIYNLRRSKNKYFIRLNVPGQKRGHLASFEYTDDRIILLAGYLKEYDIFVLWDAGLYPSFIKYRNLQVKAETVYKAISGGIGQQVRIVRNQGEEVVLTANSFNLIEAINLRMQITYERLVGR